MKNRICAFLGALAILGALAPALAASPAAASATSEVKSVAITHCLDELANSSNSLGLTSCVGAANQEWHIDLESMGDFVRFQNASTGACLADRSGTVQVTGCDPSSPTQLWTELVGENRNDVEFQNAQGTANGSVGCLTQSGFQVVFAPCSTSNPAQNWQITS